MPQGRAPGRAAVLLAIALYLGLAVYAIRALPGDVSATANNPFSKRSRSPYSAYFQGLRQHLPAGRSLLEQAGIMPKKPPKKRRAS